MSRNGMPTPYFFLDDDDTAPPCNVANQPIADSLPACAISTEEAKPTIPIEPQPPSHEYTAADFASNCENQYYRYVSNSSIISHVLLRRRTHEALQFSIPHPSETAEVPVVKQLTKDLVGFTLPNGKDAFQGKTDHDELMISRRQYDLQITIADGSTEDYTFYPLSPKKDLAGFYGPLPVKRFLETKTAQRMIASTPSYQKHSGELEVVNADIPKRAEIKTRKPDQNTVMGNKNAVSAYEELLTNYESIMTDDLKTLIKQSAETPWQSSFIVSQKRPEWLHRHGFRLHPMHINPQRVDNLGAARKCHNTAMMILERTVERMIHKYPDAKTKICCTFAMLLDSEVVDLINFYVCIQVGNFAIRFIQKIDALEKNPQFVKASDMASIVGILCMMIQHIPPISVLQTAILPTMPTITRFSVRFFHDNKYTHQQKRKRAREETKDCVLD